MLSTTPLQSSLKVHMTAFYISARFLDFVFLICIFVFWCGFVAEAEAEVSEVILL